MIKYFLDENVKYDKNYPLRIQIVLNLYDVIIAKNVNILQKQKFVT